MKKLFQEPKYLRYSAKCARRQEKARARLLINKGRKNRGKLGVSRFEHKHLQEKGVNVIAPKAFSLLENPEETIKFLNRIERCLWERQKVFVVLTQVEKIDSGAIAVLFSVMDLFTIKNVPFNGNNPENEEANKKLHESGFFDELYRKNRNRIEYRTGIDNHIFARSNKKVESQLGMPVMMEASEAIWGEKRICKGLQRILVELMHNTNNHAGGLGNKGDERWCLSVNHDKENKKVKFVFVDYGVGIFNSLNEKEKNNKWYGWQDKIKTHLGLSITQTTNDLLLQKLLSGEIHMTVTRKEFRGKGLPGVKQVLDRNQISNLYVVSNNAYGDVTNDKYRLLSKNFSGTFLYWELCYSNENQPWTIN